MASASHKYSVGQNVSFLPGNASPSHARVSCTIVRLLPRETRDCNTVSNAIMTHTSVSFWRASLLPHRSSPPYQIAGRSRR